jgi:hypothetical protein
MKMVTNKEIRNAQNVTSRYGHELYLNNISVQNGGADRRDAISSPARRAAVKKAYGVLITDAKLKMEEAFTLGDWLDVARHAGVVSRLAEILATVTKQANKGCENHKHYERNCVQCRPEAMSE